jgi:hypothetical protein
MRSWLAGDFKSLVGSSDYAGLKEATGKKGIVTSYLNALDLWAGLSLFLLCVRFTSSVKYFAS